eukprot:COSAG02_NODE_2083_length_9893_cov_3.131815_1_plen_197_part_10
MHYSRQQGVLIKNRQSTWRAVGGDRRRRRSRASTRQSPRPTKRIHHSNLSHVDVSAIVHWLLVLPFWGRFFSYRRIPGRFNTVRIETGIITMRYFGIIVYHSKSLRCALRTVRGYGTAGYAWHRAATTARRLWTSPLAGRQQRTSGASTTRRATDVGRQQLDSRLMASRHPRLDRLVRHLDPAATPGCCIVGEVDSA